MLQKEFEKLLIETIEKENVLLLGKGKEYAEGNNDRLYNFKDAALRLGLNPLQIWFVYFSKHHSSLVSFLKNNNKVFSGETIQGRIHDMRNYLVLFLGLLEDMENERI